MSFQDALDATKELRKHRLLRSLTDRDDNIGERQEALEPIQTWAEEITEKVEEVSDLMGELADCDSADLRDFQENLRYALDELLELLGQA